MWEDINCNICQAKERRIITRVRFSPLGGISNLVKCKSCGLNYISPRYAIKEEVDFYTQEYHELHTDNLWLKNRQPLFRLYLNKINKLYSRRGRLLDIGCGKGFFLKLAESNNWRVSGIDISSSAVKYGREKLGLNIEKCELKDARFPKDCFDVVTLFNVLDQLYNPADTLKEIYHIIKPGGLILLRVANIDFHLFVHRIYNIFRGSSSKEPTVFHLYMFSRLSLTRILEKEGFQNIKIFNSPADPGLESLSPYFGRRLAYTLRTIVSLTIQLIFFISLRRCVWGPSLVAYANKP